MKLRRFFSARGAFSAALVVACMVLIQSAAQAQTLTPSAVPPSGVSGVNTSYVTGSGFPTGAITGAEAIFGAACSAPSAASAPATVASLATLRRFGFEIPAGLKTGTYYVWVKGTAGSTPFNTLTEATPSCSEISVTASSTTLAACVPTSSLAVTVGTNVDAYVPFGSWGESGTTGIERVPLEGTDTAMHFATTGDVNSCASNSETGEVVCTENSTNVDLINGSTLTTLTSSANDEASFSGGACYNCGVGVNAANNTAVIAGGFSGLSGDGVQVLNLSNNTFNTAVPLEYTVSEDISIDSGRNLVLSPDEEGYYDLLKIGTGNSLTEYGQYVGAGEFDSAAEDCTTGIALSSIEFTSDIYITDLTQAVFTPGSPAGTWTGAGQVINLDSDYFAAGTCGISSAPGTGHLAVVTGEFGGNSYAVLKLPSTSGSGTPALADWAYVASMPTLPNDATFTAGFDPHTVTAYTSPTTGKSYAVFADWPYNGTLGYYEPDYLAVVDLACVLSQTRSSANYVSGDASACTTYVAVP